MSWLSQPREKPPKPPVVPLVLLNVTYLLQRLQTGCIPPDVLLPYSLESNSAQSNAHLSSLQLLLPNGNDAVMPPPHSYSPLPTASPQPYTSHLQPYLRPTYTPTHSAYYPSINEFTERPEPFATCTRTTQQMQAYREQDQRAPCAPHPLPQIRSTGRNYFEYPTSHVNPASGYQYARGPSFSNPPVAQGPDMNAVLAYSDPWSRSSAATTPAPVSTMQPGYVVPQKQMQLPIYHDQWCDFRTQGSATATPTPVPNIQPGYIAP